MYDAEVKKPDGEMKLSANQVSELVYGEFGVPIHNRTICCEVAAGRVWLSPFKTGLKGYFPKLTFQHLIFFYDIHRAWYSTYSSRM